MFDDEAPKRQDSDDKSIILFLGLYLLLLAFFIVLNSISTFEEEKTYAVLSSVAATFGWEGSGGVEPRPAATVEGKFVEPEEFHEKIADLVQTAFPLAQIRILTPDRLMQVSLPAESVFFANETRFRDEALTFLADVADVLDRNPPGVRYETEVILAGPWITARELSRGETLEIARSGAFAAELIAQGARPEAVTVGVDHDEPGQVRFLFRIRSEDEPRVDFRELAG